MTDLELAVNALTAKSGAYDTYWDYYQGTQPVVYTAQRLKEIFRDVDAVFVENWCAVVIDAVLERFNIAAVDAEGVADAAQIINTAFGDQFSLVADDTHEAMLVTGEAYVVAWPDAEGNARAYYNDPRMCHVFYETLDPYTVRMGCKWFVNDNGETELTLYYPDRLEHYAARRSDSGLAASAFMPMLNDGGEYAEPNPYGTVPVFRFQTHREPRSELASIIPLQNGINKLLIDMMVAAEYGAFKQRWIIAQMDPGNLRNSPNEIWLLPAGDGGGQSTQVGEFSAQDLGVYLNAVDKLAGAVSTISRTPRHYFFGQGGAPSGEALIAMEAPLNKKTLDYTQRVEPPWRRCLAFVLQIAGHAVDAMGIMVRFDQPETVQPLTQAQIRAQSVQAGMPLVTAVRREGWSDADIEQMAKDKDADSAKQQATLAGALVRAQRQFDQGGSAAEPNPLAGNEGVA